MSFTKLSLIHTALKRKRMQLFRFLVDICNNNNNNISYTSLSKGRIYNFSDHITKISSKSLYPGSFYMHCVAFYFAT